VLPGSDPALVGGVEGLSSLDPWAPLAVHRLASDHHPFSEREHSWYSDDVGPVPGCNAWLAAEYEAENEEDGLPPYYLALYIETGGSMTGPAVGSRGS